MFDKFCIKNDKHMIGTQKTKKVLLREALSSFSSSDLIWIVGCCEAAVTPQACGRT